MELGWQIGGQTCAVWLGVQALIWLSEQKLPPLIVTVSAWWSQQAIKQLEGQRNVAARVTASGPHIYSF